MSSPAITILMPGYNAGRYIREAIESALAQTFTDFELLIINDGSTDDTLAIIQSFSDPRIRLISRENRGLIASLNEGIHAARAPLIARHDADDIMLPQRLEMQHAYITANPDYAVVGSDVAYIDKDGVYVSEQAAPDGHTYAEIVQRRFHKCPFLHPTVLFQKSAVIEVGGYPAGALQFEDWLLWVRVMEQHKVCNLREVLVQMRINPESVTIDERWRPAAFHEARMRSLKAGVVSAEDYETIMAIVKGQDFSGYKKASYHAFVAKKYLWDNPQPALARRHLAKVIKSYPAKPESYLLYLLSFLPPTVVRGIYKAAKSR